MLGEFGLDIAWYLTMATGCCLLLAILGSLYIKYSGQRSGALINIIKFFRELALPLLLVWLIRSFVLQPYRVPSGSLMPTIYPGDLIMVQQYAYGLRWPLNGRVLWPVGQPQRGDLALFHCPVDPTVIYIKRVIGLPGDHVVYAQQQLYINGQRIERQWLAQERDISTPWLNLVERYQEQLGDRAHDIYLGETDSGLGCDFRVPAGHYLMLGDNRDNSSDSRVWGLVPDKLLIGKAMAVWISWDSTNHRIRWERFGLVH